MSVLVEERGAVLLMTLDRPAARNAITSTMMSGLAGAVQRLDGSPHLRVGVLHGADGTFCSGMDLKAFLSEGPPRGLMRFVKYGAEKPLIAAVEGDALAGGLELALTADLIVAASDARFGLPEVRIGLFAAAGGLLRVPDSLAMRMALTGDPVDARTAHAAGLVTELAEPGCALDVAVALAERIAGNAPLALSASKAVLRGRSGRTDEEFWGMQRELLPAVMESADLREGARAFAEKRRPEWRSQ